MTEPLILSVDHGTSGMKAALVTSTGAVTDFEFRPTETIFLPGGGAEQDPGQWWNAFLEAAGALIKRNSDIKKNIAAVSVSSTFSSTVALDRDGNHLHNCLSWMDSRGAPHVKNLMSGFPEVDGYNIGRVITWIRRTGGGPSLSGKDDIGHCLYIKHELPDVYERTWKFLSSKDYLNLRLTGECTATPDSMTLFWVIDIRDIAKPVYSKKLIDASGLDSEKLPDLIKSTDIAGYLKRDVADALGLAGKIPVAGSSPDHQCALVGSGAVNDFDGHLYLGTSSWIECIVPFKKTDMFHNIASLCSSIPGKYQCVNEQDMAGGAVSYLIENILCNNNDLCSGDVPGNCYELFDRCAARVPPGSEGVIMTPWLNGERSPVDSTTLRGGFHNLSMRNTSDHLMRAVLEGVAMNTRWNLRYVEKFINGKMNILRTIGGGAKSSLWMQIMADVLGREVHRTRDPIEANSRGAALIASVALGHVTFSDIPEVIPCDGVYTPDKKNMSVYDDIYSEFIEIYRKNRSIYGRLNSRHASS